MQNKNLKKLSTTISYMLRHNPKEFNLLIDEKGWVNVNELMDAIKKHNEKYEDVSLSDIKTIVKEDEKGRYQLDKDKIRAVYGHSLKDITIEKKESIPKIVLYHGTTEKSFKLITVEGLKPMNRQRVCLSEDIETAMKVALRRKNQKPVILVIDTESAIKDGVKFYSEGNGIWEVDYIAPKYFKVF